MTRLCLPLVLLASLSLPSCTETEARESPSLPQSADTVETTDHYIFISHPWLSLHHFLYQWAKADNGAFQRYSVVERDSLDRLSPPERKTWNQAVSAYADRITEYDLTHNETMRSVRNQLRDTPPHPDSLGPLSFDLHTTLQPAMRVYRSHWWTQHEVQVRNWTQVLARRLKLQEDSLVSRLEHAYGGSFPKKRIRVFVMPYTNWAGGYTTIRPPQISLAVQRFDSPGNKAMEMLLHETAHSSALSLPLKSNLRDAFSAYNAKPPRGLWHAVIFYTSGEITRKYVVNDPSFRHYGERVGLYEKDEWTDWIQTLDQHWKPYLNGTDTRHAPYRGIARSLAPIPGN